VTCLPEAILVVAGASKTRDALIHVYKTHIDLPASGSRISESEIRRFGSGMRAGTEIIVWVASLLSRNFFGLCF